MTASIPNAQLFFPLQATSAIPSNQSNQSISVIGLTFRLASASLRPADHWHHIRSNNPFDQPLNKNLVFRNNSSLWFLGHPFSRDYLKYHNHQSNSFFIHSLNLSSPPFGTKLLMVCCHQYLQPRRQSLLHGPFA